MAERPPSPLESELADLGERLGFPPTPALAGRVRAQIGARGRVSPLGRLRVPRWQTVALVTGALAVLVLVIAASPGGREAVADRLGLRGVRFFGITPAPSVAPRVPHTPDAPAGRAGAPTPGEFRPDLRLGGVALTLEEARAAAAAPIRTPTVPGLERPDEVYLDRTPAGGLVSLVYRPRAGLPESKETGVGLLITQVRGLSEPYIRKGIPPGSRVEAVRVDGAPGYWIEGVPHVLIYQDAGGTIREDRSRLAGNTLLWERDGVTFRLESALPRDQALRIAESMR